jgi:hypothetical protein
LMRDGPCGEAAPQEVLEVQACRFFGRKPDEVGVSMLRGGRQWSEPRGVEVKEWGQRRTFPKADGGRPGTRSA